MNWLKMPLTEESRLRERKRLAQTSIKVTKMGNPKGFIEIERKEGGYRPIKERIYDYGEVEQTLNENDRKRWSIYWSEFYDCRRYYHWEVRNGRCWFSGDKRCP